MNDTQRSFISEEDSFQRLASEEFLAFVSASHYFYYKAKKHNYTEEQICKFSTLKFGTTKRIIAMLIKKGSPLKEFLSVK